MSAVRMSELIDPIESTSPAKEGVNALRARFENIGQSENKPTIKQNLPGRSSSPLRPLTPPVRRTQGPQRPPPPRPVRPPHHSNDPSPDREHVRSPVKQLGQNQLHPLTNSRARSLGDLHVIKKDKEGDENSTSASPTAVEEVDTPTTKRRRKSKSKDNLPEESSGTGKRFWQKSKSTDVKNSPKVVPDKRKFSAPAERLDLPRSVPKKEALAAAPELSSSEASSKEGTPNTDRRKSDSWKRALKKTDSNMTEVGSESLRKRKKKGLIKSKSTTGIDTSSESERSGGTPRGSPWIGRKREVRETDLTEEAKRIREAAVANKGLS